MKSTKEIQASRYLVVGQMIILTPLNGCNAGKKNLAVVNNVDREKMAFEVKIIEGDPHEIGSYKTISFHAAGFQSNPFIPRGMKPDELEVYGRRVRYSVKLARKSAVGIPYEQLSEAHLKRVCRAS